MRGWTSPSFGKLMAACAAAALPGRCLVCGEAAGAALCALCEGTYWAAEAAIRRCMQCGIRLLSPFDGESAIRWRCGRCTLAPPAFDATTALADYRPPLDILAITFKFRNRPGLAQGLAHKLAERLLDDLPCASYPPYAVTSLSGGLPGHDPNPSDDIPDVLLPVPLSTRRLNERGYNQAWELARQIAERLAIPGESGWLVRRHTVAQSRLGLAARQRNMQRAIGIMPGAAQRIAGAHIGVVDDVMTTGTTFEAIARTLKSAGARRVSNYVIFRTA